MNRADEYLHEVKRHLYGVPPRQRREVLDDLRAYFADAAELGVPPSEAIVNLGEAEQVAERARLELAGGTAQADAAWRGLVWASVCFAVVLGVVMLFLTPERLSESATLLPGQSPVSHPLLAAGPVILAVAVLPFPQRLRTPVTLTLAIALTLVCVLAGAGVFAIPSCLLMWAALIVWVRLRGDGFGPAWRIGIAVLALVPFTALAAPMAEPLREVASDTDAEFLGALIAFWVVVCAVALAVLLVVFGVPRAGWMLAVMGATVLVVTLVVGGVLSALLIATGGLWLALGLGYATAAPHEQSW